MPPPFRFIRHHSASLVSPGHKLFKSAWKILEDLGRSWKILEDLGRSWKILEDLEGKSLRSGFMTAETFQRAWSWHPSSSGRTITFLVPWHMKCLDMSRCGDSLLRSLLLRISTHLSYAMLDDDVVVIVPPGYWIIEAYWIIESTEHVRTISSKLKWLVLLAWSGLKNTSQTFTNYSQWQWPSNFRRGLDELEPQMREVVLSDLITTCWKLDPLCVTCVVLIWFNLC